MIRFAQIADTHLGEGYEGEHKDEMGAILQDGRLLTDCLKRLDAQGLDFVLFCGDLVHEAGEEGYRRLKAVVDDGLPNTPAHFALGNHDNREAFLKVFHGRQSNDPYYYTETINGVRLIVLDSNFGDRAAHTGGLNQEQVDWFVELMETPAEGGSIVALHHPIVWDAAALAMPVSDAFRQAARDGGVQGIFCGHIHQDNLHLFEGIPQITGDSLAFGIEMEQKSVRFTTRKGYNLCTVGDDCGLSVRHVSVEPKADAIFEMDMEAMMRSVHSA